MIAFRHRCRGAARVAGWLAACLLIAGCQAPSSSPRLARYRPSVADRSFLPAASRPAPTNAAVAAQAAPPIAVHSATNRPAPAAADPSRLVRRLQTSDPVVIRLLKSPQTEQYEVVIDELGCVTLPFIGAIKIGGLTPQEAERLIEKTYIEEQYYQKIDVNVLAQQGEYYVSGEVKREGKYQLTGDTTLRQAIATAGGYTEFANRRRIHITRGRSDLLHDAEAIEKGAEDPFIRANDTIKVERKSWP